MADTEGMNSHDLPQHDYHFQTPQANTAYPLKGCNSLDWGVKNRLSKIFRPDTGKTVMLAVDHGYFMGPTTGLERIDLNIVPLLPYADTLMCTRGVLRSVIPPTFDKGVVLRASAGPSILKELSHEYPAVDLQEAIRLNSAAMAVQVFVGGEYETLSIKNLTHLVDQGNRYGLPVLGVTAVGKNLTRDAKYMRLASRICAELGASYVKTYYVDKDFETVTASCPVPIVIAGGKKIPEKDAMWLAYKAIDQGALGVDMGRNIFQSAHPLAMIQTIGQIVHQNMHPDSAWDYFQTMVAQEKSKS